MSTQIFKAVIASTFLLPATALSQDGPDNQTNDGDPTVQESNAAQSSRSKPYELVITPTISRASLRDLIDNVEDDFFEKFNELNIDDNYDILCYKHTPILSHLTQRVCEPYFLYNARASNSSETTFLLGSRGGKDTINQAQDGAAFVTPNAMKRSKKKEFEILQEKMEELNRTDEELRSIGSVLAQLRARLATFGQDDN